jgi:hypothetical protein
VTIGIMSAALIHAAKKFPFTASSIVPTAKGSVEVGIDGNGNTEVDLRVEHLANPTSLLSWQANYIVWLQEKGSGPENQGELKVNEKLQGSSRTVTPSSACSSRRRSVWRDSERRRKFIAMLGTRWEPDQAVVSASTNSNPCTPNSPARRNEG